MRRLPPTLRAATLAALLERAVVRVMLPWEEISTRLCVLRVTLCVRACVWACCGREPLNAAAFIVLVSKEGIARIQHVDIPAPKGQPLGYAFVRFDRYIGRLCVYVCAFCV